MATDIKGILAKMVKQVFGLKGMPATLDKAVTRAFYGKLWGAVTDGYGPLPAEVDYDTPDGAMINNLRNSVYHFSCAKNYQQLKALTAALVDDKGKLLPWAEYKRAAALINDKFVGQWLETERDTAIACGQMASKWLDIQANKSTLTMLEFDAVNDNRTTQLCKGFDGVIRPVDDNFWDVYYPPNHFKCRSTVRQRSDGKATNLSRVAIPEKIPEMFKVNLAKQGLVFPKGHPYYEGMPDSMMLDKKTVIG